MMRKRLMFSILSNNNSADQFFDKKHRDQMLNISYIETYESEIAFINLILFKSGLVGMTSLIYL